MKVKINNVFKTIWSKIKKNIITPIIGCILGVILFFLHPHTPIMFFIFAGMIASLCIDSNITWLHILLTASIASALISIALIFPVVFASIYIIGGILAVAAIVEKEEELRESSHGCSSHC